MEPIFHIVSKIQLIKSNSYRWIFTPSASLSLQVWDHDKLSKDDFAGQVEIPISFSDNWTIDEWFTLHGREGKKDKHVKGQIHVRITVRVLQVISFFIFKTKSYIAWNHCSSLESSHIHHD